MALTRPQIRGLAYLRIEGLGGKRTAVTIDADGIIDPTSFQRSLSGIVDFKDAVIYRPNVEVAEQIRQAGLIDANKLKQTGAAYTDLNDLEYELLYLIHPYVINECIRGTAHVLYGEVSVPLTMWDDGDVSRADILGWNSGTVAAPTKSTAYKSISNQRSLVVPTSGGNLYAQSDDVLVEPGDSIFHAAIGSLEPASSGTAYYALWDRINNRAIYEAEFSSYRDQIIRRQDTIPAGCTKIAVRAGATSNGVTTVWKGFPSHQIGAGTTGVQPWIKELKNFLGFHAASYGRSTGTDRFNFTDRIIEEWPNVDYRVMPFVPASEFYSLQINRPGGLQARDYWIHGYRRMSDIQEEIDDEAASTDIDEEMLMTAVEYLICKRLGSDYAEQMMQAEALLNAQRIAKTVVQPTKEKGFERIGMRR